MKKSTVIVIISAIALFAVWQLYNRLRVITPPVDTSKSEIGWAAKSISGGHEGKIQLSKAYVSIQNGKLIGGEFTIDMRSITVTDIDDPQGKIDFISHISNEDFFETNLYPTASFSITSVKNTSETDYEVTGNATIKNITQPLTFKAVMDEKAERVTAHFAIDRTMFGIEYGVKGKRGSEKDWFIYNDISLSVNLVTTANK